MVMVRHSPKPLPPPPPSFHHKGGGGGGGGVRFFKNSCNEGDEKFLLEIEEPGKGWFVL